MKKCQFNKLFEKYHYERGYILGCTDVWNAVKLLCLRNAWCPLLDITYEEDSTQNIGSRDKN